tara:strand:+ start:19 stop:159 length:141 start_codon:yes stop_codon:yes gene_type:complete
MGWGGLIGGFATSLVGGLISSRGQRRELGELEMRLSSGQSINLQKN